MTDIQGDMLSLLDHQHMVAGVRFTKIGKLYHFDYSDFPDLQVRDYVISNGAWPTYGAGHGLYCC
jgi:hypothetical protein